MNTQSPELVKNYSAKGILLDAPLPVATKSYSPTPHAKIIDTTLDSLAKAGMKVVGERYSAMKDGKQGMGFYRIADVGDSEMGLEIGWHNSYDKTMKLKWAIGGHVFICGNGMIVGDMGTFVRKHTGDVLEEYATAVKDYVTNAQNHFDKLTKEKDMMKNVNVTPRQLAEMLGRMYVNEDIINSTELNIVKRELSSPTFDYKADGTLWQFYNHITYALKEAHPVRNMKAHVDVHNFLAKEFSLS